MTYLLKLREVILNIAYKACEGKENLLDSHSFQYNRSVGLISVAIVLHFAQLCIIFFSTRIFPIGQVSGPFYLKATISWIALILVLFFLFPKKLLNLDNQQTVESVVRHPKLLAFGYLFVNLVLLLLLMIHFQK